MILYLIFSKLIKRKAKYKVKTTSNHKKDVLSIISNVISSSDKKLSLKRDNSETHCTRSQDYKRDLYLVDISMMDSIISIDIKNNVLELEPLCTMESITNFLLEYKYRLPVTPEFKGITIGGTIAGGGLESSSYIYGLMQESILEYDIILGNGSIVTVTPEKHRDLFYGAMWSLGTLGIIVRIKVRIIPNESDFVRISYEKFNTFETYNSQLCEYIHLKQKDFIEGVQLNPYEYVLISGNILKSNDYTITYRNRYWWDMWFITRICNITRNRYSCDDIMHLNDYLFRWDRGIFWLGLLKINPSSFIKRFFFGYLFDMETHHTISRWKSDKSNEKKRILTDVGPPLSKLKDMDSYLNEEIKVYPVWHLPFKIFRNHSEESIFSCEKVCKHDDIIIDFGIYGVPRMPAFDFFKMNKDIEKKVHALGGMKGFETVCYYSQEEYKALFDIEKYEALRCKYFANNKFPTHFEKIVSMSK